MTKELIQKYLSEVPAHPVPKTKICMYDNCTHLLYMPDGTQKNVEKTTKLQNDLATEGYQIRDVWRLSKNENPFGCIGNTTERPADIHDFNGKTIIELSFFRYCPANQKWSRTTYHGEEPRYLVVVEDKEVWYNDQYLEPHQRYNMILPESCSRYGMNENMYYGVKYYDIRGIFSWNSNKELKARCGCEYIIDIIDRKYQEV